MIYKFTNTSKNAMEIANQLAIDLGHNYVGTEHLLYGLVKEGKGVACKVLENQAITADLIYNEITELIGTTKKLNENTLGFTPRTKRVLENSFKEAKKEGFDYIGTEHILLGIMKEGDSIAVRILLNLKLNPQKLYNEILKLTNEDVTEINRTKEIINKEKNKNSQTPTLNQFGINLTKQAEEGKLDPVIGRNVEIERVIQILSRRTKNNPCLIGEPGVGKTAVVEGLAQKIINGDVPEILRNKKIITIDISSMVAGAKYRGDFEERIKKALNEVKKEEDIILFIDEIHTIVGAGSAEGAIDAANILKPLLARNEIQLIGATTINEYRKYIEKDSALERRFSTVNVEEPSKSETIKILEGLRDKYESHHNLKITDEAINSAVELSSRYINDRFLPDKAIDLIDEAASSLKIKVFTQPDKIKELEKNIEKIKEEKEESIKVQNFERAVVLRNEEEKLKKELEQEHNKWNSGAKEIIKITEDDIAEIVSKWTGIPSQKINESENEKLKNLENTLHKRVIGQTEAVKAITKAIKRSRLGLRDPNRPISSFIFLGPTGVGKTELSKALAESLFGKENEMIRIDMSEYMESHSLSKLIGAPPGYVGFDEGGQLTEKVRRKPYSVILFDEIEKAHQDIMNVLLQILEDGRLTDSQGRVVNFKNTIIIMTSNIGARAITNKSTLGFSSGNKNEDMEKEYEDIKKEVMHELKQQFRPELINRIDEIIVFHKLSKEELKEITKIMIDKVKERLSNYKINVNVDESVYEYIVEQIKEQNYGARPLRRIIQTEIEDFLTDEILNNNISKDKEILLKCENNKIVIE